MIETKVRSAPTADTGKCAIILSSTMSNPTAAEIASSTGIPDHLVRRTLGMLHRLKMVSKHSWHTSGRPSRWVCRYGFGESGDEPCPGRESLVTRKLTDTVMKIATIKQITSVEPLTTEEMVFELKVHSSTVDRLVMTLRDHDLMHIGARLYNGMGHPEYAYSWGPGKDAKSKPPKASRAQMREWKASSYRKAKHLEMISRTAGASPYARIHP